MKKTMYVAGMIFLPFLILLVPQSVSAVTATITFSGSLYDTNSGTHTVTATPALNDLIVIVTANTGSVVSTAPTDNAQGGVYILVATALKVASADRISVFVRQSLIMDGVSTIFSAAPGTTTGGGLSVWRVSGQIRAGAEVVRQNAFQSNIASGTPAPVFTRTPVLQNPIIAAMFNGANPAAMTPRAGYTEDTDTGYATPTTGIETMRLASSETSATITWGSSSATAFGSVAIELYVDQTAYPSLIATTAESPGGNCANGGQKMTIGLDNGDGGGTAFDGILQAGEVDSTVYICNGTNGSNGANGVNGFNSLILTVSESPGLNCLTGGIKINTGLDNGDGGGTPRDGILQTGEFDAGPFYVCNGSPGIQGTTGPQGPPGPQGSPGFNSLVKITSESAGAHCTYAGIRVDSGLDNGDGGGTANDGILQSGEIDSTGYSCNGTPGANGANGHAALVSSAPESPGSNCANGGIKITSGTDLNDDTVLQVGEITNTSYACNGANGTNGTDGAPGAQGPAGQDARAWILFSMIASLSFLAIASAFQQRRK